MLYNLTTFITPFGRFRFTRLPFGISSGPEVFHRAMQQVLQGLCGVDCFIDDVLVWGTTREEHDERLRLVLDRCKANGVRLQPEKCMFRSSTVRYCGHVLTENGPKVDWDKVKAVSNMNKPTNREELRRFLGLVAYVPKFLQSVWAWTPAQDEAFQRLKEMTSTAPVLAYYSQGAPTIVSADASSYGIGAVLFQIQEDGRRAPVTYVSRSLSATEKRYSQIEKEALAMSWAFEKFHCYLLGSPTPTVVETDHEPLQTIMNVQQLDECPPRLMRMKLRLLRYCYTVQYVPGKTLAVADALSRAPVDAAEDRADTIIADLVEEHVSVVSNLWPASDRQLQRIRDETLKDPQLATLLAILKSEWPTTTAVRYPWI